MLILFCGDPHFKVDNIPEVELFIERIEKLAQERQPDLIIIGGDLLHTHEKVHIVPLNKAYDFVRRMRDVALTYILVGNHDMTSACTFLEENHWMNAMKEWENVVIVDKPTELTLENEYFVMVPYVPNGRFIEALNTLGDDWEQASAIFAHQEFRGCKMGITASIHGDLWNLDYPQVISGHIHGNQTPQKNVYYPGSAMQHAFGESGQKVIAMCTFNQGQFNLEEVNLGLPRKKTLTMDVTELDDFEVPKSEDKLRITVNGVYDDFKTFKKTKKYKKLISKGIKVVFRSTRKNEEAEIGEEKKEELFDFRQVLHKLVVKEKDEYLLQAYEKIINDTEIDPDEIMIL